MIVVDASVVVAALVVATDQGDRARARLGSEPEQHAPGFIDIEVVAAIRNRLWRGQVDEAGADDAVRDLADLAIVRYPHVPLIPRIWELRHDVTPYDAAFVALAEVLDVPLLVADGRLARAVGPRCAIELLT